MKDAHVIRLQGLIQMIDEPVATDCGDQMIARVLQIIWRPSPKCVDESLGADWCYDFIQPR